MAVDSYSSSDVVPERRYLRRRRLPTVGVTSGAMPYSTDAGRVAHLARQEAVRLRHNYVGTEHILLGLISEQNAAVTTLQSLRVDPDAIRQQVDEIVGTGNEHVAVRIGGEIATDGDLGSYVTPRAKRVLELSSLEALKAGADHIGAEHVLLGLIREGEGVAAQVLVRMGADLNRARRYVRSARATPA